MDHFFIRLPIVYLVLLIATRIMGKREIGQLSSIDFVVAIVVAELATLPITAFAKLSADRAFNRLTGDNLTFVPKKQQFPPIFIWQAQYFNQSGTFANRRNAQSPLQYRRPFNPTAPAGCL